MPTSSGVASILGTEKTANKAAVGGYCPLDENTKVPEANLNAPFNTTDDVTASRVVGTVYRNLTGTTMMVHAVINADDYSSIEAYSDSQEDPVMLVDTSFSGHSYCVFTFLVQAGDYYKLVKTGGAVWNTLLWVEYY